jgi:tetratricopeptide (TPR) repeat protein
MNMGDFVEAVKTLDKACDVFTMLGEGETSSAYCLMMLGVIHKEVGDLAQSEKLLKQAVGRAEALAGAGKSILGESLQHLAGVYYRMGNYAAAEQTQLKAMQVLQEALGESPVLIGCRSRLARIYIKSGQIAQAETMLKNASTAGKQAFGENSPVPSYATQYLGELYVAKQDFAAAAPLLAQALAIREKGHGENHPAVAEILESYSAALRGLGRTADADRLDARKRSIDANLLAVREKLATVATRILAERPTR